MSKQLPKFPCVLKRSFNNGSTPRETGHVKIWFRAVTGMGWQLDSTTSTVGLNNPSGLSNPNDSVTSIPYCSTYRSSPKLTDTAPSSPHQGQEALLLSQAEHGTNYWDGFSASNLQPGTVWGRLSTFPPGWVCGKIRTNRITFFFNCNRKEKSKTSLCLKMLLINLF